MTEHEKAVIDAMKEEILEKLCTSGRDPRVIASRVHRRVRRAMRELGIEGDIVVRPDPSGSGFEMTVRGDDERLQWFRFEPTADELAEARRIEAEFAARARDREEPDANRPPEDQR